MVQRSGHTAWKVKAGVAKRYPTWERSPIFVQLGLNRADSSTEAAEKGGGAMGEKGKRSIKRQLRVPLFVCEEYNSKLKHKRQPLKRAKKRPSPSPPLQKAALTRRWMKTSTPWHWFVWCVTPSPILPAPGAPPARSRTEPRTWFAAGSIRRGERAKAGGERRARRGEGREMTRAFTVMRLPL